MILFKRKVVAQLQEDLDQKVRMMSQCLKQEHSAIFNNNYWEANQIIVIANKLGTRIDDSGFWKVAESRSRS